MIRVDCRTTTEVRLDAEPGGEVAVVIGQVKLVGPLIREHLEEAVKLLRLHDLGETLVPDWHERQYLPCEGGGMAVERRFLVRDESVCHVCETWQPVVRDSIGATFADHTRRIEAVSA